ncbi:integral membrane protein 2B-like [Asterias amurensis]|uniref:integral membrane protein 2B-like n=1 Tax=Asterias amurensis TaxID=7602 RepID=UPI003AB45CDC
MKIHSTDGKLQQAKVVYDGSTYTTVTLPSTDSTTDKCNECDVNLTKSSHPEVTPTHHQTRCWTFGISACCIFSLVASVGLFGLLYSAARPVSYAAGECEYPIFEEEQQKVFEVMTADEETRIETFDVPQINENHPATVLYDFYNEVTVYLDRAEGVCFIMKLNTSQVVQPKTLLEAFVRYLKGDFSLDFDVIREKMHVDGPPISDIAHFGAGTDILCHDLPVYRLTHSNSKSLRKRSISSPKHTVKYFNGLHMVELSVDY